MPDHPLLVRPVSPPRQPGGDLLDLAAQFLALGRVDDEGGLGLGQGVVAAELGGRLAVVLSG